MGKLLLFLSFCCLLILEVFSYKFPTSSLMWLASSSTAAEQARFGLMALLCLLLITNPPRHTVLRTFTGIVAMATLASVAYLTYNNHMSILDTLAFAAAGVTLGVAALELGDYEVEEVDIEALRQAKVYSQLIPKH